MVKNASAALLERYTTKQKEYALSLLYNANLALFIIQLHNFAFVLDKHHSMKAKDVWLASFLISGLTKKMLANRALKDLHSIIMKTCVLIRIKLTGLKYKLMLLLKQLELLKIMVIFKLMEPSQTPGFNAIQPMSGIKTRINVFALKTHLIRELSVLFVTFQTIGTM